MKPLKMQNINHNRVYLITFLILSTHLSSALGRSSSEVIAKRLNKRYDETIKICKKGKVTKPAFQCSGILIRGINPNNNLPHFWSAKADSQQKKSIAFGYLRQDAKWPKFPRGYESGFILYPHLKTPKKKNKYKVFCAFPLNASTDSRGGRHGCGQSSAQFVGTESKHCDQIGITDFDSWKNKHFLKYVGNSPYSYMAKQCAFDMTKKNAAAQFKALLQANKFLNQHPRLSMFNNELLIHLWRDRNIKKLPIEALFYLDGSNGLSRALNYQADFKAASGGEVLPIVRIRLPSSTSSFQAFAHS